MFATRAPLRPLPMASQQQRPPRRRSARLAFGDDERKGYEEEDDGFQFTRKRSKKAKPAPAPVVAAEQPAAKSRDYEEKEKQKPVKRLKTFDTPTESERPKRRSGRLSGERVEGAKPEILPRARRKAENGREHEKQKEKETSSEARTEEGQPESVTDAAPGPTKISLPFADTPVIARNKQMRKGSPGGRRRSSAGMRGRRASSLIEQGSNAIPHRTVEASEFYKHISSEGLSEPRRMKQLLTWCATRALGDKPAYSGQDGHARLVARVIQEELLKDLSNSAELSDWFNREETAPTVLVKKPNPRNISDAAKIQSLEAQLKKLRDERSAWEPLSNPLAPLSPALSPTITSAATIDAALLDSEQASILSALQATPNYPPIAQKRLAVASSDLELRIDTFADGIHYLSTWRSQAERVADAILAQCAERLEERDRRVVEKAGMGGVDVKEVLRSISRLDR